MKKEKNGFFRRNFNIRSFSQIFVLGLLLVLTLRHMNLGIEKAASIDAFCPFGAVEGFLTYLSTGEFLKRIYISTFIILGLVLILTIVFGRVFCSYLCPLGALQEWIRKLGKKIGINRDFEFPKNIDNYLRYAKYVILFVIIYFSFTVGDLIFRGYDPFVALMHLGEEFSEMAFGYSILIFLLIISLFSKNIWCRYFCPFGATLGIFRKLSPFKIKRDKKSCISCGTCDRTCPSGLNIEKSDEIKSADCISCMNCVSDCPNSSLKASVFGKNISKRILGISVASFFFVALSLIVATPLWQTKASSNIVMESGSLDADNLRGSNTLKYVIDTTKIPYSVFQKELGLPEQIDMSLKLKDIGPTYEIKNSEGEYIETEDFREVLRNY